MSQNINAKELLNLKYNFLEYVEIEKGRSLLTIRNYDHYINRFFKFLNENKYTIIDDRVMREYRLFLNRLPSVNKNNSKNKIS